MKRASFFESKKAFDNNEIRRTVLLSGARRTGKTTIMYQTIAELLKNGINPKDIAKEYLKRYGINISTDANVINTYSSIKLVMEHC